MVSRCGYGDKCPAMEATCHRCNFSSRCFSKTAGPSTLAEVDATPTEAVFLDAVNDGEVSTWKVTLSVQCQPVEFKIDTGAAVTAINEETYRALHRPRLTSARKVLYGPAWQSLEVLGVFRERLHFRNKEIKEPEVFWGEV